MSRRLVEFLRDESGAITLDWIVLTAAVGLLGFVMVNGLRNGSMIPLSSSISKEVAIDPYKAAIPAGALTASDLAPG